MEEDKVKEAIVENTTKLVGQAYEDIAHPVLKTLGSIVSLPFKAIDAALTPIKKWIDKKNFNYEETKKLLAKKLEKVDESKIVEPEPYVAVPALQQLEYSYDSEDLRNMYANLLSSSMIYDTKYSVHPSFVDIIKQLSPIDARALEKIFQPEFLTIIKVRAFYKNNNSYIDILNNFSIELEDIYYDKLNHSTSLLNLVRLGIIEIKYGNLVQPESKYDVYENHLEIKKIVDKFKRQKDVEVEITRGLIELTDFGLTFCMTCCDKNFEI